MECSDSRITRLAAHYELKIRTKWWNEYRTRTLQERTSGRHTLTSKIVRHMPYARATWRTVRNLLLLQKEGTIQVHGREPHLRERREEEGEAARYSSGAATPGVEFRVTFNRNRQCDPQLCPLLHRCSALIGPSNVCGSTHHSARDHATRSSMQTSGDKLSPRKSRQSLAERADSKRERSRSPFLLTRDSGRLHRHLTSSQWHFASGQWCRRLPDESRGSRQS